MSICTEITQIVQSCWCQLYLGIQLRSLDLAPLRNWIQTCILYQSMSPITLLPFMQVLQISICLEQINIILLVLKNPHIPQKTSQNPNQNKKTLESCFTFIGKADLMTGLVNVLDHFATLQCRIWGLEFQSQGPPVI